MSRDVKSEIALAEIRPRGKGTKRICRVGGGKYYDKIQLDKSTAFKGAPYAKWEEVPKRNQLHRIVA
jgi:hypothetical protein